MAKTQKVFKAYSCDDYAKARVRQNKDYNIMSSGCFRNGMWETLEEAMAAVKWRQLVWREPTAKELAYDATLVKVGDVTRDYGDYIETIVGEYWICRKFKNR